MNRRNFLHRSSQFTISTLLLPWLGEIVHPISSVNLVFGLATDSHYADREPAGTRFYRQSLAKMDEFVEVMNREKVDFVVHLGDFKDEDPNQREEDTLRYLKALEERYGQFKGPRYHCIGNHDVDSIRKEQFLANIENTGISKTKSYYSFDRQNIHFVVIDANYHKDGRDQFYKEGANWQDPNIPQVELDWLEVDLANTDKSVIIFCHHPLYVYPHEENHYYVNNYRAVQEIMEASGKVRAVFQGHVHHEHYAEVNGIHYITQLGMVDYEGIENNSFAMVELSENGIKIQGFERTSDWEG